MVKEKVDHGIQKVKVHICRDEVSTIVLHGSKSSES